MSVKIQGLVIRYEGDAAGVSELLRTFTGLIGQGHAEKAAPSESDEPQPLIAPRPTPDPEPCKLPCVARAATTKGKPGPKPKGKPADDDRDGDRYAPRGSELQQKIIDYVRLKGPTPVRDLAVAMQRAGQAIGKAVSTSDVLMKDGDKVIVLNDD